MSNSPLQRHPKPTKRTYGSSNRVKSQLQSSPRSTVSWTPSSPVAPSSPEARVGKENKQHDPLATSHDLKPSTLFTKSGIKRKASALEDEPAARKTLDAFFSASSARPTKKSKTSAAPSSPSKTSQANLPLIQMHLALSSKPIVRTCPICNLSYTLGTPEDEQLHKRHHARVVAGVEWTRAEEGCKGVEIIEEGVQVGAGDGKGMAKRREKGRVLAFEGSVGGRVRTKLDTLLETVNTELSAPALSEPSLSASKIFLFLLPSATGSTREKVVGCVVAQRIEYAMRVVPRSESEKEGGSAVLIDSNSDGDGEDGGLFCDPTPLQTPLGISRLWTSAQHRKKGIATALLDAACRRTIYGCELDPAAGQVAFSQPTNSGRGVMTRWGKGGCRIFNET